ncbi:MAG: HEAT repeat domain-containing protein [Treponema sp.]|jgi:hypothetical protein|nr:HEAT repeat domain-containing protein [Treponema sp.]
MVPFKRFSILILTALIAVSAVSGQANEDDEMSVEESYLQEAIEMMIIRETSRADGRDQKLIALEYIGNALERGSTNEELRTTLEFLSLEGVQHKTMENGRVVNNYPDVRRQAAKYLGDIGTEEAKTALIKICTTDTEPMVLQEAVKSLGNIGLNNNDETVNAIVWIVNRFNTLNPDNLLALSALDALDKIAKKNRGIKDAGALQLIIKIADGPYVLPVKTRARQVLLDMRQYAAQEQQKK